MEGCARALRHLLISRDASPCPTNLASPTPANLVVAIISTRPPPPLQQQAYSDDSDEAAAPRQEGGQEA